MILIISKHVDDFVNQVIDCIDGNFIRLGDLDNFHVEYIEITDTYNFFISDQYNEIYNLCDVSAIWFNGCIDPFINMTYENKSYTYLFNTFLNNSKKIKVGRFLNDFEINKLDVLIEAKNQGFLVPETIFINNKRDLQIFFEKHKKNNGIISKRIIDNQHFYLFEDFYYNFNLTFIITQELINKMSDKFSISLVQERILSDFEIRVVFLNDAFYAMSIHDSSNSVDYRTNFDNNKLRMIPFNLPKKIQVKLRRLFKKINLNFGSVDLMFVDSEYYFLEINTTGQISFLNNACNYYLEYEFIKIFNNEKQTPN